MKNSPSELQALAQQLLTPPYIGDRQAAERLKERYREAFRQAATPEAILELVASQQQLNAEVTALRPVELDPKDLRIDAYSNAPSGWSRSANGVRVIHLPTGLEATAEGERTQHANRGKALAQLGLLVAHMQAQLCSESTRVPAGFYRELVALRELREAVTGYRNRYMLDEIECAENCVSAEQHEWACQVDEKLKAAQEAVWIGQEAHRALVVPEKEEPIRFDDMSRKQLSAWYVEHVGYDPAADDPTISDAELRELCLEMSEEHEKEDAQQSSMSASDRG